MPFSPNFTLEASLHLGQGNRVPFPASHSTLSPWERHTTLYFSIAHLHVAEAKCQVNETERTSTLFSHTTPIVRVEIPFQAWQAKNTCFLLAFIQITHWVEVPCSKASTENQEPPLLSSTLLLNLGVILRVSTPSYRAMVQKFCQKRGSPWEQRVLMICSKKLTLFETHVREVQD